LARPKQGSVFAEEIDEPKFCPNPLDAAIVCAWARSCPAEARVKSARSASAVALAAIVILIAFATAGFAPASTGTRPPHRSARAMLRFALVQLAAREVHFEAGTMSRVPLPGAKTVTIMHTYTGLADAHGGLRERIFIARPRGAKPGPGADWSRGLIKAGKIALYDPNGITCEPMKSFIVPSQAPQWPIFTFTDVTLFWRLSRDTVVGEQTRRGKRLVRVRARGPFRDRSLRRYYSDSGVTADFLINQSTGRLVSMRVGAGLGDEGIPWNNTSHCKVIGNACDSGAVASTYANWANSPPDDGTPPCQNQPSHDFITNWDAWQVCMLAKYQKAFNYGPRVMFALNYINGYPDTDVEQVAVKVLNHGMTVGQDGLNATWVNGDRNRAIMEYLSNYYQTPSHRMVARPVELQTYGAESQWCHKSATNCASLSSQGYPKCAGMKVKDIVSLVQQDAQTHNLDFVNELEVYHADLDDRTNSSLRDAYWAWKNGVALSYSQPPHCPGADHGGY
jgi:hypothetical protein